MNQLLLQLTRGLPLRLAPPQRTPWATKRSKHIAQVIRNAGFDVASQGQTVSVFHDNGAMIIDLAHEVLLTNGLDRDSEVVLRRLLLQIRAFGNQEFRGADWCAYKRRRLTIVEFTAAEETLDDNLHLQLDPRGLFADQTSPTVSRLFVDEDAHSAAQWRVGFPQAPYHLGVIQPRLFLERLPPTGDSPPALTDHAIRTYLCVLLDQPLHPSLAIPCLRGPSRLCRRRSAPRAASGPNHWHLPR